LEIDLNGPQSNVIYGRSDLVNKFAYQFGEPQRWDVIVSFPGNAKQNYIKRLVGLPGETIRIRQGDIYTRRGDEDTFVIACKPPRKLLEHAAAGARHAVSRRI
jgi:signal peptidase I